MLVRPPTPIRTAALAAIVALLIASCGGPTTPEPEPTPMPLALTGASPDVALPGASVTLTGTGFDEDREVTFDGVPATVLDATDTTLTVVVPETYGYPTIAVDDESADGLVFVGSEHAGAQDLDAVQASLDALPAGAALRLPAGTYGAPGTGLDVDNRSLYGVGAGTLLDLDAVTGELAVFARLPHGALVADLAVVDGDVMVFHGRMTTAQIGDTVPLAPARFERVTLDVATFGTPTTTVGTSIEIVDTAVTAAGVEFVVASGALRIDGSAIDVAAPMTLLVVGSALEVRDTAIGATALAISVEDSPAPAQFVDVAVSSTGPIQILSEGAIEVDGTVVDAADVVVFGVHGVTITDSTLASDGGVILQTQATVTVTDSVMTSVTSLVVGALQGVAVTRSDLTSATAEIILQSDGSVAVQDATLAGATTIAVVGTYGGVVLADSDVATAGSVFVNSFGPVLANGGSWSAGTDLVFVTEGSAGVALRGATSVTAGGTLALIDGAGVPLFGSGGTITFEANGPSTVGTFVVSGGLSDVVLRDNAPIEAGAIAITTTGAHIDIHDNERLASTSDLMVQALGLGARLSATGNAFVADVGAGTIQLETEPGALTVADNTYLAFTVTLIGE